MRTGCGRYRTVCGIPQNTERRHLARDLVRERKNAEQRIGIQVIPLSPLAKTAISHGAEVSVWTTWPRIRPFRAQLLRGDLGIAGSAGPSMATGRPRRAMVMGSPTCSTSTRQTNCAGADPTTPPALSQEHPLARRSPGVSVHRHLRAWHTQSRHREPKPVADSRFARDDS